MGYESDGVKVERFGQADPVYRVTLGGHVLPDMHLTEREAHAMVSLFARYGVTAA